MGHMGLTATIEQSGIR